MTNEMIVLYESVALMEKGVIKGTGKFVTVADADGNEKKLEIPEEIHTFAAWKSKGYKVKKGEHAVANFPIWKYVSKTTVDEETGEELTKGRAYLKNAAWFTAAQVERMGVA